MRDEIVRAMTSDGYVKAVAVTGRDVVERARQIHTLLPMATAALGRALMGTSMLGDMLKTEKGSVTMQIKGGGPLGTILAVSDYEGNVRGYVQNPNVDIIEKYEGKLDVGAAVGGEHVENGTLTIIKDIGMKEPYVGAIGLWSGEIADDLAMYFVESEQIPTVCALGVLLAKDQSVTSAGGYIIQLLPGATEEIIEKIERGVQRVGAVSAAFESGMDAEAVLKAVLSEFEVEVLEKRPIEYRCYCDRERVTRALISMGRGEMEALIEEQGEAELTCQFCDAVYHYSKEELEAILAQM
ncbi:MAG: Hsp33 family molecular chaperone HslO [Clostridium sp.]|nr:Hsp33 family molecular chaperone HslO [Clostridium sp.]